MKSEWKSVKPAIHTCYISYISNTSLSLTITATSESCGPVPYVENADVVSGDDQLIASLVISCHVGHRFPNGKVTAQLQCEQDKVWTWTNNLDSWECLGK